MKMLVALCLGFLCSYQSSAAIQTDSLRHLLTQREQLVKDYQFYNAQNNNFWGKKSKKDLLLIIETLKGVIRKDTEIINTIKESTLRKAAQVTLEQTKLTQKVKGDRVSVANTMYSLKTQIANLQNLEKSRQRKIIELEENLSEERDKKRSRDFLIAFLSIVSVSFLIIILKFNRKYNQLLESKN